MCRSQRSGGVSAKGAVMGPSPGGAADSVLTATAYRLGPLFRRTHVPKEPSRNEALGSVGQGWSRPQDGGPIPLADAVAELILVTIGGGFHHNAHVGGRRRHPAYRDLLKCMRVCVRATSLHGQIGTRTLRILCAVRVTRPIDCTKWDSAISGAVTGAPRVFSNFECRETD